MPQKCQKQVDAKRYGVINLQIYNSINFITVNFDALKSTAELGYNGHVPSGTLCSISSDTHQVVEIWKETSTKMYTPFFLQITISINFKVGKFWCSKQGWRRSEFLLIGLQNSQTPLTSKVWPSGHLKYYKSCVWPFYKRAQICPRASHSDLQDDRDYMTGLVQTSSEETRPWSSSLLIVSRDSFSPWTSARVQIAWSIAYSSGCHYIFLYNVFITIDVCVLHFMTFPLGVAVSTRSLSGELSTNF